MLLEEAISKLHAVAKDKPKAEVLLDELKLISTSLGFASEYRYWVLICACFNASKEHNIVKTWKDYEKAFLSLVKQDGKVGIKHLLQAIVLFFIKRHAEQSKFAGTFMKLLVCDQQVFSEEFIVKWFNKE